MTTTYATNAHLREEDGHLFAHDDTDKKRKLARASEDVRLDLAGHGYFKSECEVLIDSSAMANTVVQVTVDAQTTIPAGTRFVRSQDCERFGGLVYVSTFDVQIPAGETGNVMLTAVEFGEVYNAEGIDALETIISGVTLVRQPDVATGGKDHQLTRATTYRAMELICSDLMRERDDAWDHKRAVYCKMYKDELRRRVAAGLQVDRNGDGEATGQAERRHHGFHRFQRG